MRKSLLKWAVAFIVCVLAMHMYAGSAKAETVAVDLSTLEADYVIESEGTYEFTGTTTHSIKVAAGVQATVVLNNVAITAQSDKAAVDFSEAVYSRLELADGSVNTVTGGFGCPGVFVPLMSEDRVTQGYAYADETLILSGNGKLIATGGMNGAGIGGGSGSSIGLLYLSANNVEAYGGYAAAGIGSGTRGKFNYVSIKSANLVAVGGDMGPGLGAGRNGYGKAISITDSFVTATGGFYAPGIGVNKSTDTTGVGYLDSLYISNSEVYANGGSYGPGIGGSLDAGFSKVRVTNGSYVVTNSNIGVGIGDGETYSSSTHRTVTVEGNSVFYGTISGRDESTYSLELENCVMLASSEGKVYGTANVVKLPEVYNLVVPADASLSVSQTVSNMGIIQVDGAFDAVVDNAGYESKVVYRFAVDGGVAYDMDTGDQVEYAAEGTRIRLDCNNWEYAASWFINNVRIDDNEFIMPASVVNAIYTVGYSVTLPSKQENYTLTLISSDIANNTYRLALTYDDAYVWPDVWSDSGNLEFVETDEDGRLIYSLSGLTKDATITVDPMLIRARIVDVSAEKVYDGTTAVTITGGRLEGIRDGDDVGFEISNVRLSGSDAGTQWVYYNVRLTGSDASKYSISVPSFKIEVAKASQVAPAGLTATDTTAYGAQDGTITGLDATMEWRAAGSEEYTAFDGESGTLANLAPGAYFVRVAGDANHNPSEDVTLVVASSVEAVSMHRVYNPNSGEHFYTASEDEKNNLVSKGWKYEGIGWTAPSASTTPVYRLYSGTDHHYTVSESERDMLMEAGWSYEGVGWYSDDAKGVALYRQFNPNVVPTASRNNSGSHNYTTSKDESDMLVSVGWIYEGTAWYGLAV